MELIRQVYYRPNSVGLYELVDRVMKQLGVDDRETVTRAILEADANLTDAILSTPIFSDPRTCSHCTLPIGLREGQCTGWHPDFKCGCGFEMAGGNAPNYKFCPMCGKAKESNTKGADFRDTHLT